MRSLLQTLMDLLRGLEEGRNGSQSARERSLRLLENNLSPAQRQQWMRHRYFDVIGGGTGRYYRIHHGCTLNIAQLNASGGRERLLCFEPKGALPIGDVMLAQKLALELFELEALAVANATPGWWIR